jgi:hypothetical protein
MIKPFDFGSIPRGMVFPTFPTRKTSVQSLGNSKKLREIQCFMNIQTFGQIRKPLLYPFELWGLTPEKLNRGIERGK